MQLSELFRTKKVVYSFEIFPPKRDSSIRTIYDTLDGLYGLQPDFISVTYGAGGNTADTSTADIASIIKNKYNIEPLAHLTCLTSTRADVDAILKRLRADGVENILALRGDENPNAARKDDFLHASDLAAVIRDAGGFDICGACYPEGHPASRDLESDIETLKYKVDAGISHFISQLFFDNADFYNFMYHFHAAGLDVPVEAGIMPVTNRKSIQRIVSLCGASLPKKFIRIMTKYENDPEALRDAGIAYATEQIIDLVSNGVRGIHLYTMNNPFVARRITENVGSIIRSLNK